MKRKDFEVYKMLTRVADFGTKHVGLFPTTTIAGEILSEIVTAVSALSGHTTEQLTAAAAVRRSSNIRKEAREALVRQLESMEQTARVVKINDFWMPNRPLESSLIKTGHHFAEAAEGFKTEFIQHGLAPDFIEKLKTVLQNLEGAILSRKEGKDLVKRAIDQYETMAGKALDLLARFEVLVSNSLADTPGVIAEWEAARRVEKAPPSKVKKAKPGPPPNPQPATDGNAASATAG